MKKSKKFFVILACVLGILLVLFTIYWFGLRNLFEKEKANNTLIVDMSDPNGNTDYGMLYYTPIDEEHIVSADGENSVMYIDNEVLIVVVEGTTRDEVVALSEKYNAEIVGEIEITGDYQLRLSEVQTQDGLSEIVDDLNSESIVETAILNYVMPISESKKTEERDGFYYGEKWYKDLQNFNNAEGKSWGLEAIGALGAWDKLTHTSRTINPVKVGVIDNGFDVNHEDLQFAEVFYDNGANGLTASDKVHGTHVSGTMAADNSNTIGICGVYPYGAGNLYGVSNCAGQGAIQYNVSLMAEKVSFAELIVRNVKVINSSRGFSWYKEQNFAKWYDKTLTDSHFDGFEERSDFLGEFFQKMLDQGYDFVIVSAAGNNSNGLPTKFDASYSFWLNGISGAKYSDVYNRIIVVGAVDQNLNIASYSDGGNRVDIYAPGGGLDKGVYSTLPNSKYGSKCGVDIMSGTSMAAPHVAGVAAMVWSANNSLTGAEVKEAIIRRSNSRCTSCKMVDAYMAVGHALGEDETGGTTNVENGGVLCYVVQKHSEDIKIPDVDISMKNIDTGEVYTTKTDELGHFEIMLPEGKYTLTATKVGYEDYEWPDGNNYQNPIIVKNEGINYLDDWIKMTIVGEEEIQLSVFALDSDDLSPITNKEIEITLESPECFHMFDAFFEKEILNPANIEFVSADVSEYPRVKLYLRVTDPNTGTSIENILMNSFNIEERFEGGEYLSREVKNAFPLEGNDGLKTALVADKSDSISDYDMDKIKSVMIEFVNSMDFNAGDEAMVIAFDSIVQTMCTFTSDQGRLTHGIQNMSTDGRTACYDAIYNAVQNASLRVVHAV